MLTLPYVKHLPELHYGGLLRVILMIDGSPSVPGFADEVAPSFFPYTTWLHAIQWRAAVEEMLHTTFEKSNLILMPRLEELQLVWNGKGAQEMVSTIQLG